VKSLSAVIAVRPLLISSSKTRVGLLKSAAVRALPIEMLAPAANVPSNRSSAIKFPPSSTTAITPPGAFLAAPSAFAAAITLRAPSSDSEGLSSVCADAAPANATNNAAPLTSFFITISFSRWRWGPAPIASCFPAHLCRFLPHSPQLG
jgi:hypothetical protein